MKVEGFSYKKTCCRLCESKNIKRGLSLTPTPPGNNFLTKDNLNLVEETFPLELDFCNDCFHIQLGHVVDPEFLFQNDYSYVSSTSRVFVEHLKNYADSMISLLKLNQGSLVIDIGSNDGTCLSFFQDKGMEVLGVDPAESIAQLANNNGIKTINNFFNEEIAQEIKENYSLPRLITSHNACAHIDDLMSVINGVDNLMGDETIFVMEVGYFVDVFQNKWFDTIYHEHVDFHTVAPLKKLFHSVGMEIFSIERIEPQGGSIRVMVQRKHGTFQIDESVEDLISLEASLGLNKVDTLHLFEQEINTLRTKFKNMIKQLKEDGKSIAAFGAPTKATTLSYHFDLEHEDVDFIVDDNPLKQGLYSPGKHIPVYDSASIYEKKPDILIILAWNFAEDIMKKHKKYGEEIGSFLIPMPLPKLI